jgi:hypothetical protein
MRTFLLSLFLVGCDDGFTPSYQDLGVFRKIGDRCDPDSAGLSECGYPPQYYCSSSGLCAAACNRDDDCLQGRCVGASDGIVGECRLPLGDGGS